MKLSEIKKIMENNLKNYKPIEMEDIFFNSYWREEFYSYCNRQENNLLFEISEIEFHDILKIYKNNIVIESKKREIKIYDFEKIENEIQIYFTKIYKEFSSEIGWIKK